MKFKTTLVVELELPEYLLNEINKLNEDFIKELCFSHYIDIVSAIKNDIYIKDDRKLKIKGETIID